ncbi:MAG: enoyl-CoA hydratase/isomerase family protein [Actinobacteria bacterium]|nr:enoyl-CoA hydratase/isomerase family protein [Actinomycetota bacterium]
MSDVVRYEQSGSIVTITMNRPDQLNALNDELSLGVAEGLERAASDAGVRCVVLQGAGRAFSSGADLSQLEPAYRAGEKVDLAIWLRERYHKVILPIVSMEKPVIAAVNGVAAGAGCSIALACDFRIASDKAKFFQAFIKVGLVADSGANYFLPRLVGFAKAMELALLGDVIDAETALRYGLVTRVAPHDELDKQVAAFAEQLAAGPTKAFGASKRALHFGALHDLASTLEVEAELQSVMGMTEDHREGVMAFLEKRAPNFRGE